MFRETFKNETKYGVRYVDWLTLENTINMHLLVPYQIF